MVCGWRLKSGIISWPLDLICAHGGRVAAFDLVPLPDGDPGGENFRHLQVDVSDAERVESCVHAAAEWLGGLDGVANVAGTVRDAALADGDLETMRRVLQVDLLGPLYVCRSAFGFLRESEGSAVVNVSSLAATIAYAGGGLYGASKGWARSDVPADGCRMGPFGIRVNVVAPGQIETPLATRPGDEAIRAERVKRIPIARRGNPLKSLVRSLSFCLRVPVM